MRSTGFLIALFLTGLIGVVQARSNFTIRPPLPATNANMVGKSIKGVPILEQDVKFLEPVCKLIIANDSGEIDNHWWNRLDYSGLLDKPEYVIARGVRSFHHYCWGQISQARMFRARSKQQRISYGIRAVDDYRFVLEHPDYLPPGWPYKPKMLAAMGRVLAAMDKEADAVAAYLKALEHDPAYEQAHLGLAEVMQDHGKKDKALAQVTEGLRHNPDSSPLKKRYAALGGKPPYPKPIAKVAPAESATLAQTVSSPAPEASGAPVNTVTEPPSAPLSAPSSAPAAVSTQTPDAETPTSKSANPYCRFCP